MEGATTNIQSLNKGIYVYPIMLDLLHVHNAIKPYPI